MVEQPENIECPQCGQDAWNDNYTETIYKCESCGKLIYYLNEN